LAGSRFGLGRVKLLSRIPFQNCSGIIDEIEKGIYYPESLQAPPSVLEGEQYLSCAKEVYEWLKNLI